MSIKNVILFCFQDDLQGIISSILYTGKWLTHDQLGSSKDECLRLQCLIFTTTRVAFKY